MEFLAYIDPGTGSVIAQALIGAAVGIGVLVKTYWSKIKSLFGKNKQKDADFRTKKSKEDE